MFADGEPDGAEDRWFAALGSHVADILHEVGVPYCKGGVMAKNAPWRGSLATWRKRDRPTGSRAPSPQDLLSVDIFFDMRAVHGDGGLAVAVWQAPSTRPKGQVAFAKLLVEGGSDSQRSLGLFGGFRTEGGRIDLKAAGLFGIVARRARWRSATMWWSARRRRGCRRQGARIGGETDLDALVEAQAYSSI